MHLLETYALSCGLKIDKPYVYEHYTSIPFKKFISFNRSQYPLFPEVINLIGAELKKLDIDILQLHATPETTDTGTCVFDNLTFGQWAYLLKHSMLHVGEDDFLFDLAGYYDIPRVILFSNTYPENFKPYWGSPEKQRILLSFGPFDKPTFSTDPNLNFVRYISAEDIAQNIMDLLGIPWTPPYKTLFLGPRYRPHHDVVEIVPDKDHPITLNGRISAVCVRMDYHYDEQFLISVLEKTKSTIVTDKPIPMGILQALRGQINEIAYIVKGDEDVVFARELAKLNLPYALLSDNPNPTLKEKFFEVSPIMTPAIGKLSDIKGLENGLNGVYYKSGKRVVHGQTEYKGQHQRLNNLPSAYQELSPCPIDAPSSFLRELEWFLVVKPTLT